MTLAGVVDAVLEAPVFTSFTRIGYDVRSRLGHWTALDQYHLQGRVMLITGATSGLGLATAHALAAAGAELILLGRSETKTDAVRADIERRWPGAAVSTVIADLGELSQVRAACADIVAAHPRLDVVIHNAGALSDTRQVSADGFETTVASQVIGPFLMTTLLLPTLTQRSPARVITMASGGMYATGLTVEHLQMGDDYKGAEQYARAKRAQVTLNEMWALKYPERDVVFHALHPGWADTPGVEASLPTFRKIVGPLLRTPAQGADTAVWLAADDGAPLATTGAFWLDRHRRSIHKLPMTRKTDTPARRAELWEWCTRAAGLDR